MKAYLSLSISQLYSSLVSCPHHWPRPFFPTIFLTHWLYFLRTYFTKAECFCLSLPLVLRSRGHAPCTSTLILTAPTIHYKWCAGAWTTCPKVLFLAPSPLSLLFSSCVLSFAVSPYTFGAGKNATKSSFHSHSPHSLSRQKYVKSPPPPLSLCRLTESCSLLHPNSDMLRVLCPNFDVIFYKSTKLLDEECRIYIFIFAYHYCACVDLCCISLYFSFGLFGR